MSWSKISEGHWQRPIGENEVFIKLIGDGGHPLGREHWAINADATYSSPQKDYLEHWKKAWQTLRFQQPSIAATAGSDTIDYKVPDAQALKQWTEETFIVEKGVSREDVSANHKPASYAVLHIFPEDNELLLHTSHWRTDGIGIIHLLNAFFTLASTPSLPDPSTLSWGTETTHLSPPIEIAASIPTTPTPDIKSEAEKWTSTFYKVAGATGIACPAPSTTTPSGTRSIRSSFPPTTTTSIVSACKTQSISITAAIHASLASTNWAFAPDNKKSAPYTSTIRAALRPYLPPPYNGPDHAAALYTSGYMHALDAKGSWGDNAREINELYRKGLSGEFLRAHRQYALNLTELIKATPEGGEPASDVDISSIGLVDERVLKGTYEGGLEVQGVSVGVEVLTRQMTLFVWTFGGRLSFNLVYNEGFYERSVPERFLGSVKETLVRELGVKPE